jgi:hypothetical protein
MALRFERGATVSPERTGAMTVVRAETRRRWLIVAAVTAVLCALPAAIGAIPAGTIRIATSTLAARIAASARQPYQANAVATGSVGIPVLPELADVADLFDGTTSLRIWYASPQRWRVDSLGTAGERDVYQGIYQEQAAQTIWDSGPGQLTTVIGSTPARLPRGTDLAPPDLARRLLAAASGTTAMSALPARRVGGISAAGLRLTPSEPQTTIGYVDIWADPRTGLPLEVAVVPVGASSPALVSRMLEVSMTAPGTSVTTAPKPSASVGSYVTDNPDVYTTLLDLGLGPLPRTLAGLPRIDRGLGALPGIAAYGKGFAQLVALSVPGRPGIQVLEGAIAAGTERTSGDGISAVVTTSLLNVLLVHASGEPDTVIVVGLVTPDVLAAAANELMAYESRLK